MSKTHKSIREINEFMLMTVQKPRKLIADRTENLSVRDLEGLQKTSVYIRKLLEEKTKLFYGEI